MTSQWVVWKAIRSTNQQFENQQSNPSTQILQTNVLRWLRLLRNCFRYLNIQISFFVFTVIITSLQCMCIIRNWWMYYVCLIYSPDCRYDKVGMFRLLQLRLALWSTRGAQQTPIPSSSATAASIQTCDSATDVLQCCINISIDWHLFLVESTYTTVSVKIFAGFYHLYLILVIMFLSWS